MTKFTKRLTAVIMAAAMATSMAVSASAYYDRNAYSSFTWDNNSCTIVNDTNIARYMTASFEVYEKNTGVFIDSSFDSDAGAYDVDASAPNPVTHSSLYNYVWRGAIYNGNYPYSGVVASFVKP